MASGRFRRIWLIVCLTLLGGLATAVPVNCLCDANQHWGQAVHPIFEHHHADGHDHAAISPDDGMLTAYDDSSGAAFAVSEHGSFMGAIVDGLLLGRGSLWLILGLFPLLTLSSAARRLMPEAVVVPPTGPPRPSPLFS